MTRWEETCCPDSPVSPVSPVSLLSFSIIKNIHLLFVVAWLHVSHFILLFVLPISFFLLLSSSSSHHLLDDLLIGVLFIFASGLVCHPTRPIAKDGADGNLYLNSRHTLVLKIEPFARFTAAVREINQN